MVKIHPNHSTNLPRPPSPQPPPPPVRPRRQTAVRTQKSSSTSSSSCSPPASASSSVSPSSSSSSSSPPHLASPAKSTSASPTPPSRNSSRKPKRHRTPLMRNGNRRIGVYYDHITAFAFYNDEMLGRKNLAPLYQGHKTTNTLRAIFEGNKTLSLDNGIFSQFVQEERRGVFSVVAAIAVTVRTKYGTIKHRRSPTYVDCYLTVPLRGKSSYCFETTQFGVFHIISYPNN